MFITLFYEDSVGRGPRRGRGKKWPCLVFLAVNKHTSASQKYLETASLTLWPSLHVWNHSDFFNKRSVRTEDESQRICFYLLEWFWPIHLENVVASIKPWSRNGPPVSGLPTYHLHLVNKLIATDQILTNLYNNIVWNHLPSLTQPWKCSSSITFFFYFPWSFLKQTLKTFSLIIYSIFFCKTCFDCQSPQKKTFCSKVQKPLPIAF